MNLPRLRELVQAGKDGTLRPEEAKELFEAAEDVIAELETAVYLLGQSDVKRFWLMKRNGQLETIASRYEIIRLFEERTPTFVVPCVCGHDGASHFLMRWKCDFGGCACSRYEKVTSLEVPGDGSGAWEQSSDRG